MFKRSVFLITMTSLCFAVSDDEVVHFYKELLKTASPQAQISVVEREKIDSSGFEKIYVDISAYGESVKEVIFAKDNFLFPDILDVRKNFSYKEDFINQNILAENKDFANKALEALKTEKNIVSIGDTSKPEIYVFSDPECPFCRKHLKDIDKILEKNRVNFVFVSVHGKSAFEKIALIYKETKKAKGDIEKLNIIRKYYADNITYNPPTKEEYEMAINLFNKYQKLGLKAVPTIVEKK